MLDIHHKMDESIRKEASKEIEESLISVLFAMRQIGFSFDKPQNTAAYLRQKITLAVSICVNCCIVFGEFAHIVLTFASSPSIEDAVPLFHLFGYAVLSLAKIITFWYKKHELGKVVKELAEIWPMPPLDEDARNLKEKSLTSLRISHRWYFAANVMAVWFFNSTPIVVYFYRVWKQQEAHIGYIWYSWYPFDKHKPIAHIAVYCFEMYAGVNSVWIMISSDLLFSGMASHIALLLRLLQRRLESLATTEQSDDDYYNEIRDIIKLHQRLIKYCNSLEEAFSLVNLINIVMSSVNICCVSFVIVLLEPLMVISSKLFLAAIMIQVGAMCWYANDILHENGNVSAAAYNSGWYKMSPRCRRALLFLILRSQKPIAFTALKFTNISLVTYSSIMTRSYSYFALLYTMYSNK